MGNILSTAFFPNIQYCSKLYKGNAIIDIHENYQKQTYRNRFEIMSSGGVLSITAPIIRDSGVKVLTKDIRVDNKMDWQRVAWKTIVSAYNNSPYFEHYEHLFEPIFSQKHDFLIDLNEKSLSAIEEALDIKFDYTYSESYVTPQEGCKDWRDGITPKKAKQMADSDFAPQEYYQVFSDIIPFAENLSILDLIFCEGTMAENFLL